MTECFEFLPNSHKWQIDYVDVKYTGESFNKTFHWKCSLCFQPMETRR
jgi:hypothetical protein